MSDKELLELAARAAGYSGTWVDAGLNLGTDAVPIIFNPLTDDGDAMRLAVKLKLSIDTNWYNSDACWFTDKSIAASFDSVEEENHNDDPYAATRRAIVRAAAEIGKLK